MRLDKYLKVSRLIKRRTVAKDACAGGKVTINNKVAKAGTEVVPGDTIEITYGNRIVTVKVVATPAAVSADMAHETYELIGETRNNV